MSTVRDDDRYAYLLGIYLGDGWVGPLGGSGRLTVSLDAAYPGVVEEVMAAVKAVRPACRVKRFQVPEKQCVTVYSYGLEWLELFPQHGPGRKHERPIELDGWQQDVVERHGEPFLRGLVHSDGCRTVNRFRTQLPSGRVAEYAYPRYFFSNLSADIRRLFCEACDRLGVRWTQSNHRNVSVSHRASVALLDTFIGPKA